MNNVLLYIGGFFVAVLAVLFAVPHFIDWNGYRGMFEAEASRMIGRDVRVGGEVNVRFLPTPYVRFDKIRISDAGGSSGDPLFRAESFKMWLAVPPLLRGVIEANEVELKRPVLRIVSNASGEVNWSTLQATPADLPFVPADVALQEVNLINGVISLIGPQGTELARIDGINGELNAEALEGPFKFKGKVRWEGADREVKVATARPDEKGEVRFKTTVTVDETQNSYVFDGRVIDLKLKPRVEGEFTSKIALTVLGKSATGEAAATSESASGAKGLSKAASAPSMEMRGKVNGDGTGFKLQDLAISLEQGSTPQIVTGEATMAWTDKIEVAAVLGARWLDLDRLAGPGEGGVPLEVAGSLFEAMTLILPAEAQTNVTMKLDQVNLGADQVSDINLMIERAGGPLQLKEFRAHIPGGGMISLDGILNPAQNQTGPKFDGTLSLSGQSTLRFVAWALKQPGIGEGRTDTPFSVAGHLQFAEKLIELTEAKAELGTMALNGAAKLDLGTRRRLGLTIEGQRIDAGQFFPGSVGLAALEGLKPAAPANAGENGQAAKSQTPRIFDLSKSDLALRLRADSLVDGERVLRNVDADITLEDTKLSISMLRFKTEEGLEVDVDGGAEDIRVRPKGTMRGLVAANTPAAAQSFFRLLDLDDAERGLPDRLDRLAPLRLAGTVSFGLRSDNALDVKADGLALGGRLTADLRLDGGRHGWRSSPADILITMNGPRVTDAVSAIVGQDAMVAGAEGAGPNRYRELILRAAGTPARGLVSLVGLKGSGVGIDYSGRVIIPPEGSGSASGLLKVATTDGREILSLAGVQLSPGAKGVAIQGDVDVSVAGDVVSLKSRRLSVAGSIVSGSLNITGSKDKPAAIEADLAVDRTSLPRLLRPILTGAPARAGEIEAASAALTPGLWPDEAFDLSFLDKMGGTIKAKVQSLALDEGLSIAGATLDVSLSPGRVEVKSLDGEAIGGRLNSQLVFDKGAAGVEFKGGLKITVGQAAASSLTLDFTGRALSPSALMTDLKGTGEIALGDVTLTGMGPGPVAATAEAALAGKGPSGGDQLVEALKAALKQGQLRLGAIKIPVAIADGALNLEKITIETEEGRSTFETAIELATMRIDSEWRVEAKVKPQPQIQPQAPPKLQSEPQAQPQPTAAVPLSPFLPPVSVAYVGNLSNFASLEPVVEASALERELVVRKMENDVDALERLRKFDQSKAAQEFERLKQIQLERAKAAAAAAAQAAASTPAVPTAAAGEPGAAVDGLVPQGAAESAETAPPAPDGTLVPPPSPLPAVRRIKPPAYKRPAQNPNSFPTPF